MLAHNSDRSQRRNNTNKFISYCQYGCGGMFIFCFLELASIDDDLQKKALKYSACALIITIAILDLFKSKTDEGAEEPLLNDDPQINTDQYGDHVSENRRVENSTSNHNSSSDSHRIIPSSSNRSTTDGDGAACLPDGNNIRTNTFKCGNEGLVKSRDEVSISRDSIDRSKECPICLDSLDEGKKEALVCAHVFHAQCIQKWRDWNNSKEIKASCPTCNYKES